MACSHFESCHALLATAKPPFSTESTHSCPPIQVEVGQNGHLEYGKNRPLFCPPSRFRRTPRSRKPELGNAEPEGQSLLREEGHCLREQALSVCSAAASAQRDELKGTSMEWLRQLVAFSIDSTRLLAFVVDACRRIGIVWRPPPGRADSTLVGGADPGQLAPGVEAARG